jgi:crotonobetainyl-CoA:carnitine CoA-transferase CaiB-like acyl-CoA transferase
MRVKTKHKFKPDLSLIRNALTFSETPITEYRAPPLLGENTQEVLGGKLGYDAAKIASLKKQGVI